MHLILMSIINRISMMKLELKLMMAVLLFRNLNALNTFNKLKIVYNYQGVYSETWFTNLI